jgi:hypothetical protein
MRTWVSRLRVALEIVRARVAGRRCWVGFDGSEWRVLSGQEMIE